MKKTTSILSLALILAWASQAALLASSSGDVLGDFAARTRGGRLTFSYTYTAATQVTVKGGGQATVQDGMFRLVGDGLEIVCDGSAKWTLDRDAMEAIVEPVGEGALDALSNPAALLGRVDELFADRTVSKGRFQGRSVVTATMSTAPGTSQIKGMAIHFVGDTPVGLSVSMENGTSAEFVLEDVAFSDKGPEDIFHFDAGSLTCDWVVTDLR